MLFCILLYINLGQNYYFYFIYFSFNGACLFFNLDQNFLTFNVLTFNIWCLNQVENISSVVLSLI